MLLWCHYMAVKPLLPIHEQILETLAKKHEATQYQLYKEIGVSYRTILRRVKELANTPPPLVKAIREEPSQKGGKNCIVYTLTLNGLFYALRNPHLWKHFDKIAAYHREKLLVFKCWEQFTKKEKDVIKLVLFSKYKVSEYKYGRLFGSVLNLDYLALLGSEEQLKKHIDGIFTDLVIPKRLRPILEPLIKRLEPLRKARLDALKMELKETRKLEAYYIKEIEKLSNIHE